MKLVKRYDYQPNVMAEPEITREGFLKVMVRATRIGVLKYKQPDGSIVRELRHPDEVFNPDSMASLALKPFTNNHPPGLIDSTNAQMYQVGMTGEKVEIEDGKFLKVMTVITDKDTIADANKGKVEVSPGYTCELDFTPGVYAGEEYDAVQRNIRYNHLASVKKGRSGPEVRICLDSDDRVEIDLVNHQKEIKTVKINIDGKEFEVSDELGEAMKSEANKSRSVSEEMDAMKKDKDKAKEELEKAEKDKKDAMKAKEKAEAKADGLAAEIENLKKTRTDSQPSELQKAVKERVRLEKIASEAGVEKYDTMDDLDLKKEVIKVHAPSVNLDGKSAEYINARFDVASESLSASDIEAKKLGEKIVDGKRPVETLDADDSRQKMIERQKTQWKGKEE